ncbi:hypothetical protein BABINDRAFT_162999 [Babjeviella inositovora NRRL Y-12698]|uniref:Uncharacterized protein n=1 Tax=Babjeviella inositovora NRRL Y-12698 TaxID=984486 RepID=A0A1E3QK08_9ASCO|nr:uncharacterized protein BABINDRAFT_162999 [Babjeviella inositovora NRRL Y-12698]ODQ77948.1 hypothetical protein BABINDRAFT_162999 [Babjeviella inositovora NRRL Y-12698]
MSSQFPAARGRSKTPEFTGKRVANGKKFTAGASKSLHTRNSSYGRNLNKLTKIDSDESMSTLLRPKMDRSKSSDGLLSRPVRSSSKSLNKLSRPVSQNSIRSLKSGSRNSSTVLELENNDGDSSEEVDGLEPIQEGHHGLKHPQPSHSNATSTDSLHKLYGGSVLLSQSTGVERKLPANANNSIVQMSKPNYDNHDEYAGYSLQQPRPMESASTSLSSTNGPLSFQAKRTDYPVIPSISTLSMHQHLEQAPAHRPPSNGLTMMNTAQRAPESPATNNFAAFLKSGTPAPETRTQQRLWLQRENSFLDVSQSGSMNTHMSKMFGNSVQTRTESERLSREFMNVRRYTNPMNESLNRMGVITKAMAKSSNKQIAEQHETSVLGTASVVRSSNTFAEYAPEVLQQGMETHDKLYRMWQIACNDLMTPPAEQQQMQQTQQQLLMQQQIQLNQRSPQQKQQRLGNGNRADNTSQHAIKSPTPTRASIARHGPSTSPPEQVTFQPGNIRLAAEKIHLN